MWILRTVGEEKGPTFRVLPGAVKTLGRATRADFILDAALVSRLHCRLSALAGGELEVEDLGSTNGTYVNEQRIRRKALLAPGDRLRVGRAELVVERSPGAAARRPAGDEPPAWPPARTGGGTR